MERDFFKFCDDFFGNLAFSTTAASNVGHGYSFNDTSAAGAPVVGPVDGSACGEVSLAFSADAEAQNLCISQGDKLQFDIDNLVEFGVRIKQNQATIDSASSLAVGLAGDRNDAIDSIAQHALFRLIGDNNVVVETDDGVTDTDDVSTGQTLSDRYKWLVINFAAGKSDVRFFVDGQPVALSTTFDMSAYSGSLQLFLQAQKTADANTDGFTIDGWYARGRR